MSADGKGLEPANGAQVQGSCFGHVLDGRLVRGSLLFSSKQDGASRLTNFSVIVASCLRFQALLGFNEMGFNERDFTCDTVPLPSIVVVDRADESQGTKLKPCSGAVSKSASPS